MSSNTRATSKGGKGSKGDKLHKTDKSEAGKGSGGDKQQNLGNDNVRSKSDDPAIKEKVKQVIEMTQRDENEVCLVLHECEYDVELAINMLFESNEKGTWETTVKKKKSRQASASKAEAVEAAVGEEWNNETQGHSEDKPKSRSKSGGPPRLHGRNNDSRGWKGREKQENEKNNDDGGRSDFRDRRSRPGGATRGGGGGRGRGGGRAGGRFPPRGNRSNYNSRPMETWDNSNTWDNSTATAAAAATNHTEETWDDFPGTDEWSTEEYTGSLADTKVFTPSVQVDSALIEQNESSISAAAGTVEPSTLSNSQQMVTQSLEIRAQQSPVPIVGTLSAAQTQYLNQLTQQTSENMKTQYSNATVQAYAAAGGQQQIYDKSTTSAYASAAANVSQYNAANTQQYGNPPNSTYANSTYGVNSNYGGAQEQPVHQPVRTKTQRARVPPPSKIPASAVEMPGDLNSSIGYLDVQFGAMDLLDSNSFDAVSDAKFNTASNSTLESTNVAANTNLDLSATAQNTALDAYSSAKPNTQSSISSAISQGLPNTDSIPTTEHLSSSYSATASRGSTASGNTAPPSVVTPASLDLNKPAETHSYSNQSSYSSYQPKPNSFQSQTYSSTSYSGTHVTSSSYVSNPQSNNYTNSNAASYNQPTAANSYQNAYSATGSYQSTGNAAAFPSISQANSYPSNQTYPQNTSQSVYGANTGLNNSSNYSNAAAANQYSYSSGSNHKLVKDNSGYDSSTTAASSVPTTTNTVTSTALSLNQSTAATTKATTTLAKNSSNVVSNIPPGVTPVMSTPYMIGQVPFFQPPMYAYEDMQLIQQRIPHLTTPYYDMSYQTPTTLTAVRDGTLANVAYSMSDGRFTRGDNNASPVPSTLSQQTSTLTQGHQAQPILAQTAGHPGWIYPSTYNPMTPSYQFGVMYPQLPQATNAHGSSNSTQYPKPATYGSGYGSGYETLSQSQDYTKSAYVGNTQGQNKATGANSSSVGSAGSDLTAMYGKSHAALGKVNSYEKQGFHSGTPPPFTGTVHGSQNAGLAPSGTGYAPQMFIQTMAPHQQHHSHSTPLMHQPLHQIEVRHQGRRMDSGSSSGQRSQSSNQAKTASKQGYPPSYWNQA